MDEQREERSFHNLVFLPELHTFSFQNSMKGLGFTSYIFYIKKSAIKDAEEGKNLGTST